jgi:hypothetical protein
MGFGQKKIRLTQIPMLAKVSQTISKKESYVGFPYSTRRKDQRGDSNQPMTRSEQRNKDQGKRTKRK